MKTEKALETLRNDSERLDRTWRNWPEARRFPTRRSLPTPPPRVFVEGWTNDLIGLSRSRGQSVTHIRRNDEHFVSSWRFGLLLNTPSSVLRMSLTDLHAITRTYWDYRTNPTSLRFRWPVNKCCIRFLDHTPRIVFNIDNCRSYRPREKLNDLRQNEQYWV